MKTEAEARAELDRLIGTLSLDEVRRLAADLAVALMFERIDKMVADQVQQLQRSLDAQELAGYSATADEIERAYAKVVFENLDPEKGAIN